MSSSTQKATETNQAFVIIPEPSSSTEKTKEFANKNSVPSDKKYNNNKNLPNGK